MRINQDDNELDTMKELLTQALSAVIAEFLNVDFDRVLPGSRLLSDLGISPAVKKRLQKEIAFIFDCVEIEMPDTMKVEELVDQVAHIEFSRLEPNLSVQMAEYIKPALIAAVTTHGPASFLPVLQSPGEDQHSSPQYYPREVVSSRPAE